MARPCSICSHPKRKQINAALLLGGPEGTNTAIANTYGVGDMSVSRHRNNCLPAGTQAAIHATDLITQGIQVGDLTAQSMRLYERALRLCDEAEQAVTLDNGGSLDAPGVLAPRDWKAITSMLREVRGSLELVGRFTGQLGQAGGPQPKDVLGHQSTREFVERIGQHLMDGLRERLGDDLATEIAGEILSRIEEEKRSATEQVPMDQRRLLGPR